MTDDEARDICATSKPTLGAMKRVIAWAAAAPDGYKLPLLLALQTANYANRKGLADAWEEAALACARVNATPLWSAVSNDADTYRVWHAIQVLGALAEKETMQKLIELGRTKILRIHWSAIEEAAKRARIAIPKDVVLAQSALEKQRGPGDFYDVFEARAKTIAQPVLTAKPARAATKTAAVKTRTKSKQATPTLPSVLKRREKHAWLARIKTPLANRYSLTRMAVLFDLVDFAWYLVALGREAEARDLVDQLAAEITFSGNFNVWTPAADAICLAARLARSSRDTKRHAQLIARIVEHPALASSMTKAELRGWIDDKTDKALKGARAETSKSPACRRFARALANATYFRETAGHGFGYDALVDRKALDRMIADGLVELRARLG